ncbi:hypothetical protein ANANG_G00148760 [Anguilla anguilla]|uniref:Vesicular, overexpressed in cancer, prosurvival protein 1 n=1 Tax=Anguilla anguilla TaxID=7936 RepID=A0A9D3M7I9_ANGAN|nr:hypothetical protein ANANG_G00148760 [Anguilla anguilla]
MVMSQGTYTFLACFAGFWLVWALVVMLCCFCSSLQRRLKRRRQARVREHCLRTLETEPLECRGNGCFRTAPCYEEAVLMEDPPPYSEVLADPRTGTYTKPASGTSRKQADTKTSKAGRRRGWRRARRRGFPSARSPR